jgi:predicted nucleotidyltransferase
MTQLSTLPLTQCDHDTIVAVMAAVTSRWPVERIIRFGSKARGDDEPYSDIDLLVITTLELDRQAEDALQDAAWETGLEHGRCVQLVIRSHERWYHGIDQATPLRLNVDQDGVEIFRHHG